MAGTDLQSSGGVAEGWSAAPQQWDAGQLAREQAQRLYSQQMLQAQRHSHQPQMRSAVPQDLDSITGKGL